MNLKTHHMFVQEDMNSRGGGVANGRRVVHSSDHSPRTSSKHRGTIAENSARRRICIRTITLAFSLQAESPNLAKAKIDTEVI
eukprot:4524244-Amphidinium_carterae.1